MKSWRIGFWNVAGLTNKEEEFWKGIGGWEVIVLLRSETECRRATNGGHNGQAERIGKGERWEV